MTVLHDGHKQTIAATDRLIRHATYTLRARTHTQDRQTMIKIDREGKTGSDGLVCVNVHWNAFLDVWMMWRGNGSD